MSQLANSSDVVLLGRQRANTNLSAALTTEVTCKHDEGVSSIYTFFLHHQLGQDRSSSLSLRNHGSLSISAAMDLRRPFPTNFQYASSNNEQNYPGGRVGESSLSAGLCSKTPNTDFEIEEKPYAEM